MNFRRLTSTKKPVQIVLSATLLWTSVVAQSPAEKPQHCSVQKHEPAPPYPESLKGSGIQGTVVVQAIIDQKGCAESVRVVQKLNPQLDELAKQAVNSWKFTPATKDGKPVAVIVQIAVEFKDSPQ